MADNAAFLVNWNDRVLDTTVIDSFIDWHVFENIFIKNKEFLEQDCIIREIDARYDFRPDLLSTEIYGEDFYYPIILIVNNLGSMLQFKSDLLNNKCKIPKYSKIKALLDKEKNK